MKMRTTRHARMTRRSPKHLLLKVTLKTSTGSATLKDLIDTGCIDSQTVQDLQRGLISLDQVEDKVKDFLTGSPVIAGFIVAHSSGIEETITIAEAHLRGLITYDQSVLLLEAQAATGKSSTCFFCSKLLSLGGICSITSDRRYNIRDAFEMGLLDREIINDLNLN